MNSQQIEYFLSAAKHLNFTIVADEFYTSQPTISRQIALLEAELGFDLFLRDKGNLRLTVGGAIMAQEFTKADKIIHDAIAQVGRVSEGLEGRLAIGYVGGMNTDVFVHPPTITFTKMYPAIDISIEAASFAGLRKKLESGEFDVIFSFDFELPAFENIYYRKSHTVTPIIAMSSSHRLAGKDNLTYRDFSGEVLLLPGPMETSHGRFDIIRILEKLGVKNIIVRNMNNLESVLFGVRSGIGVAVLDTSMECIYDSRYSYIELPGNTDFISLSIIVIWKRDNLNPIIPIYMEMLGESLEAGIFEA